MARIVSYISILEVMVKQRKLLAHCRMIQNNLAKNGEKIQQHLYVWRGDEEGEGAKFERGDEEVRDKIRMVAMEGLV